VDDVETTLLQQLLNIAQRQRIAKTPPDRTKYEAGFGLPPFEDRGSGYHFGILSRHQPATLKVATHPGFLKRYNGPKSLSFQLFYRVWACFAGARRQRRILAAAGRRL
jgi:hypothetical protein